MFTAVTAMPVPDLLWTDWAIIAAGLFVGIGFTFEVLYWSAKSKHIPRSKVYTLKHFWLVLCGVIHCWIEFNMVFMRSTSTIKPTIDMYAAADYRYGDYGGHMESGTAAMECITALLTGPLCFLVVTASVHEFASLHFFQIITCTCQLYGLIWFTLQPLFTTSGIAGHFSSDPVLFWVIAFGCNAPWGIFPWFLLYESYCAVSSPNMKSKTA